MEGSKRGAAWSDLYLKKTPSCLVKLGHKGQPGGQKGDQNCGQAKGGRAADQAGETGTNSRNVSEWLLGEREEGTPGREQMAKAWH